MDENKTGFLKKISRKVKIIIVVVFLLLLLICCIISMFLWYGGYARKAICDRVLEKSALWDQYKCQEIMATESDDKTDNTPNVITVTQISNKVVITNINEASSAVVNISSNEKTDNKDEIFGMGFLVSEDGLIVTSETTVVNKAGTYRIAFGNGSASFIINQNQIYHDQVNGLAFIQLTKMQLPQVFGYLSLADSSSLGQVQTLFSITTSGIILQGGTIKATDNYIFTDIAFQGNNSGSGSPLMSQKAEVIGVNLVGAVTANKKTFMAIRSNIVKESIKQLPQFFRDTKNSR